jgi:hemolysin activation/secretion protein
MSLEVITRGGKQSSPEQGTGLIGWIETGWNLALPLATKIAWTNSLNLRAIYTEMELTEPELYRVGGLGNVRGYREAAFTTDRFIWWNCEIHYSLGNLSWLQLFFDSGVFRRNSGNYVLLAGYGIGARTRTKIGVIEIDFGIPFPESPLHSKIHLTFRTGF